MKIVASQELARAGAGGISASLMSHTIGSPPIARAARPEIKARVLPEGAVGAGNFALAITEPSGGSDVRQFCAPGRAVTAIITSSPGEKTFITSGMRADYLDGRRAHRRRGRRAGQPASDRRRYAGPVAHQAEEDGLVGVGHATLHFDECRVPVET
jgi:acyl-CoA dehydrogenase